MARTTARQTSACSRTTLPGPPSRCQLPRARLSIVRGRGCSQPIVRSPTRPLLLLRNGTTVGLTPTTSLEISPSPEHDPHPRPQQGPHDVCRPPGTARHHPEGAPMSDTSDPTQQSAAAQMLGDFSPGLVHFTDDVLFGEVWKRPQLSPRDRSLVTVTALITGGNAEQLTFHLQYAKDNGVTETELIEAITHLAFYAGWPKAFSAIGVAKQVFATT